MNSAGSRRAPESVVRQQENKNMLGLAPAGRVGAFVG